MGVRKIGIQFKGTFKVRQGHDRRKPAGGGRRGRDRDRRTRHGGWRDASRRLDTVSDRSAVAQAEL